VDYVLALGAALAFALGSVLQQKGALETEAGERDPHFLTEILRRPVWLAGGACQATGWILQAAALDRGPIIVVQSLTSLSLVLALPLGARITNQTITGRVWIGAAAMVTGIVLFLSVGSPQGGTSSGTATAWWSACVVSALLAAALAAAGMRRNAAERALLLGAAAGVGYALQAAVTKQFVTLVGQGLSAMLSSWTVYVLILSAVAGFVLQQSALKTGVLAPAMGASNTATLVLSTVLGVTVYDERFTGHGRGVIPAVIGLAIAATGIFLLAGAKPPRKEEDPSGSPLGERHHRGHAAG
jgi:drug/metabolite transporter (DMT)-like permease